MKLFKVIEDSYVSAYFDGACETHYVVADSLEEVGKKFPKALSITLISEKVKVLNESE